MKTLLDIFAWWSLASFLLVGAWAIVRYRQKSAKFPAVRHDIDHDPRETVETRFRSAAQ